MSTNKIHQMPHRLQHSVNLLFHSILIHITHEEAPTLLHSGPRNFYNRATNARRLVTQRQGPTMDACTHFYPTFNGLPLLYAGSKETSANDCEIQTCHVKC